MQLSTEKISNNERIKLWKDYKENGNIEAKNKIVMSCYHMAKQVAFRFARRLYTRGIDDDDLLQEALLALDRAVDYWEPDKGYYTTIGYKFMLTALHNVFRRENKLNDVKKQLEERMSEKDMEYEVDYNAPLQYEDMIEKLKDYGFREHHIKFLITYVELYGSRGGLYPAIANKLGISKNQVRSLVNMVNQMKTRRRLVPEMLCGRHTTDDGE